MVEIFALVGKTLDYMAFVCFYLSIPYADISNGANFVNERGESEAVCIHSQCKENRQAESVMR